MTSYIAVVNDAHQYSIWRADTPLPRGWRAAGRPGTRQDCLAWIEDVWHDIRPHDHGAPAFTGDRATIHALFEHQTQRSPDAVAVVCGDQELTYRDVDVRANGLAAALAARGIAPGALVGVCVERSIELPVILLGILKTGAAYVPLDPTHPPARLRHIADTAKLAHTVVDETGATRLEGAFGELITLASVCGVADSFVARAPAHAAYVMYTSGSTGTPKGVIVTHAGVVNQFAEFGDLLELGSASTWLAIATFAFDISVLELLLPLTRGGRVIVGATDCDVVELLERHRITHFQCTPSRLHILSARAGTASWTRDLRCWLVGGEALTAELAARFHQLAPTTKRFNVYGPTETTVWATVQLLGPERVAAPIGDPIRETRVHVVDDRLAPVPSGSSGEILIGGVGVALGYHGRAAATAERFVPDPYSAAPGARAYRTGDLGRWTESGSLAFIGRVDHQVKVRGFRVELGEVEAQLFAHPSVQHCVVLAVGDVLVAYHALVPGAAAPTSELRAHLSALLPDYMVPSHFVQLDELPLTPSGKVDREELRSRGIPNAPRGPTHIAPRTATELALARIWSDVLDAEDVGSNDNFFELGGHSLLVPTMLDEVARQLGRAVPLRTVYSAPTLAGFAAEIDRAPLRAPAGQPESLTGAARARASIEALQAKGRKS